MGVIKLLFFGIVLLGATFDEIINRFAGGAVSLKSIERVKTKNVTVPSVADRALRKDATALNSLIMRNSIDIIVVLARVSS